MAGRVVTAGWGKREYEHLVVESNQCIKVKAEVKVEGLEVRAPAGVLQ